MSETAPTTGFEMGAGFEQAELSGTLRLGKFEAHYEELFAEAIEDGVITTEERARLDRAAESLGLDRRRLTQLETALQAAYEARHKVKIRDLSDEAVSSRAPRASLEPLDLERDPRLAALQRRIDLLERRVRELEAELEEARAHIAVEVDLSDVTASRTLRAATPAGDTDPESLERRLRTEPRDTDTLRALYRQLSGPDQLDRRALVAAALVQLGAASEDEARTAERLPKGTLIRPTTSLTADAWRRFLFHPEEEVLTGEIFSVIVSPVLLGRVSALRRDKALPVMDPARRVDPATSTVQAVRCLAWSAAILGMKCPAVFADPDFTGALEMVPAIPPCMRIGQRALSGRSPQELAFLAGRHLAWHREERFVRLLVPAIADLEDLFLAALHIGNPGLPLSAQAKQRVLPLAQAIEPMLDTVGVDRLRGAFLRFVEDGGRTNLQRWSQAAEKTAQRAGLLLAGDLGAAERMLKLDSPKYAAELMNDLLIFQTSSRYAALRSQLGIAIAAVP